MQDIRITVNHPVGFHLRPAAQFVQTASKYASEITVENITSESAAVNAKSLTLILTLEVHQGHEIEIVADGTDEQEVITALKGLVDSNSVRRLQMQPREKATRFVSWMRSSTQ